MSLSTTPTLAKVSFSNLFWSPTGLIKGVMDTRYLFRDLTKKDAWTSRNWAIKIFFLCYGNDEDRGGADIRKQDKGTLCPEEE